MTKVAGEVCDGFLAHGFTTERYIREVTMPALEAGLAKAGRSRDSFEVIDQDNRHAGKQGRYLGPIDRPCRVGKADAIAVDRTGSANRAGAAMFDFAHHL